MLVNFLLFGAVVVVPPLLVALVILGRRKLEVYLDRRRSPSSPHPPIERLSADLRRIHRYLIDLPDDAPALRRTAAEQAYDALLESTCQALDVDQALATTSGRMDRDIERLRIEEALRAAGLRIP